MNNTLKWIIGIVIVVLVVWLIVTKTQQAGKDGSPETGGDTYKIGALLPLTGDAATYGEPGRNMYQLAVKEINDAGGVNGKKLELIVEDSKCTGKDAVSAAQKLVNVDKVEVIIGGFCSSESLSAIPVAEASKVALLSPGSSSPDLTGKSKFFFRNYPSDASQGSVLAELAYSKNWKKVAFLQEQLDYPLGIYKAFNAKFESLGGTIVKEEFPSNTTDFRSQLTKLREQSPDVLFIDSQTSAGGERILKQLQDLQWKPQLMLSDSFLSDAVIIEANKTALEGAIGAEFGIDPANQKFLAVSKAYTDMYGSEVNYQSYAFTEYDAVYMIRDAIAAVGYDGQKIAEWGRTVKGWQGASGSITIGADGDRLGGHEPKIVRDGKSVKLQ